LPQKQKPRIKIKADWKKIEPAVVVAHEETTSPAVAVAGNKPSWEDAWLDWEQEKKAVAASATDYTYAPASETVKKQPVLETKFSQSLDDIKEQYVEKILLSKPRRTGLTLNIKNFGLTAVLLLIAGTMAFGLWKEWNTKDETKNALQIIPPEEVQKTITKTVNEIPAPNMESKVALITNSSKTNKIKQPAAQKKQYFQRSKKPYCHKSAAEYCNRS